MRTPIFVRTITDEERQALERGLRSSDAFVLRRCQVLLASAKGQRVPQIAHTLCCDDQTALNAIHAFNQRGLASLTKGSSRPHTIERAFSEESIHSLRTLMHRSPRDFGKESSVWTLQLAVEVSFEQGLTREQVSAETVRATFERLRVRWQRAKEWIASPDPQYTRKKAWRLADGVGGLSP
jgi:transposase